MARIRTIKPEFWSSPDLPPDPWTRLLYIAMWNWADDNGVGTANPRELQGFAFPNDEHIDSADIRRMLGEIRRVFGVDFYTVAGRPYFSIPSWEKHQKIDKRSAGRYPTPDNPSATPDLHEYPDSEEPTEDPPSIRRIPGAGTGEQGNRGKLLRPAEPDGFEDFWAIYPRKEARRKAATAFGRALRRASLEEILAGTKRYAGVPRERQFTKLPEGWLNGDQWADEVAPAVVNGHHFGAADGKGGRGFDY